MPPIRHSDLLRLVVVGSVDDGKSTLIGRLLYETDSLPYDQVAQIERLSRRGEDIDFSLFTDGLRAEREQGITIDVAYRTFATERRAFIVADTPGHEQYTRNMATGASTADLAVVLLDVTQGLSVQTRRHAYLAALLGIPELIVAVNKIDRIDFDAHRYDAVRAEAQTVLSQYGIPRLSFVPLSARQGDNVVDRSARTDWYEGPPLLELLESAPPRATLGDAPFRFPVQGVLKDGLSERRIVGQIAAGRIRSGDEVVIQPSGQRTQVAGIEGPQGAIDEALAPASVALILADDRDVGRGDLLVRPDATAVVAQELEATLVWLDDRPFDAKRGYRLRSSVSLAPVETIEVRTRVDLQSLAEEPASGLGSNDVGTARVVLKRPLPFDHYRRIRGTGAFVLIDYLTNQTVAAGMVRRTGAELP